MTDKNQELKLGEMVYVDNSSIEEALKGNIKRKLIYIKSEDEDNGYFGVYVCISENGSAVSWKYAVKVPEKKIVPFEFDSFPLGIVYLGVDGKKLLVTGIGIEGVWTGDKDCYSYDALLRYKCKISTDLGKTWQVAGIEE